MKLVITDLILLLLFNSRMFYPFIWILPLDSQVNFPSLFKAGIGLVMPLTVE